MRYNCEDQSNNNKKIIFNVKNYINKNYIIKN